MLSSCASSLDAKVFQSIVISRNQRGKNHALNPDLLIHQIYDVFSKLSQQFNEKYEEIITEDSYAIVQNVVLKHCGFCLAKRKSDVAMAGLGVFVKDGRVPKNVIVAFYPGTVYRPGEAAFLQSLGNKFVLRCIDGTLLDGNDRGLSKLVFKSCTLRDRMGKNLLNDMTWLTELPANPLAIGQYVNNAASDLNGIGQSSRCQVSDGNGFTYASIFVISSGPSKFLLWVAHIRGGSQSDWHNASRRLMEYNNEHSSTDKVDEIIRDVETGGAPANTSSEDEPVER